MHRHHRFADSNRQLGSIDHLEKVVAAKKAAIADLERKAQEIKASKDRFARAPPYVFTAGAPTAQPPNSPTEPRRPR